MELQLSATNAVKALALREESLPAEGCQAGSSISLFAEVPHFTLSYSIPVHQRFLCYHLMLQQTESASTHSCMTDGRVHGFSGCPVRVQVTTEDEAPLDAEAAAQGLTIRLTPPGSGRADEIVASLSEGASNP